MISFERIFQKNDMNQNSPKCYGPKEQIVLLKRNYDIFQF